MPIAHGLGNVGAPLDNVVAFPLESTGTTTVIGDAVARDGTICTPSEFWLASLPTYTKVPSPRTTIARAFGSTLSGALLPTAVAVPLAGAMRHTLPSP